MALIASILFSLVVGTWNGNWFPSGRAEHRASPEKENETTRLAAEMLSKGLAKIDPEGDDDVVICLNEMRNASVVSNLISKMTRKDLYLSVITRYRRRDRFDQQQDAIITSMPVASKGWAVFKKSSDWQKNPPRGYAFSEVISDCGAVTTHVYSVHLKSEYGATSEQIRRSNRYKRGIAIEQIVNMEKPKGRGKKKQSSPVIIAGDLNADRWQEYFSKETLFHTLFNAGFLDAFEGLEKEKRSTRDSRKWGSSTIDYVFYRQVGEVKAVHVEKTNGASDHNAVFVLF
ncbi:MAG: endonuclease/exonuclease/phosphatase family protein [Kiritimatiellae bacterium]|nr:endonuclease/exonuclease/phosphatase family protein [Kiritimatiellia bacterium]